ncbi:MAG: beta-lactamase family protein [Bacteroidales bacterium]|nr:beta-lactamase family protein [Bacteroidales bacterium]
MKNLAGTILIALGLTALLLSSCGRHHQKNVPELNTDSLFIELGKDKIERCIANTEKAFNEMRKTQGLNGAVLYAEGGKILFRKAYGWRNLVRPKDSIQIDDQFQLASVSKMFTAEAIMLLHFQGKLDYDDQLTKYIPEFPYEGITIRHLLNHRSGLSRYEVLADEQWPDRCVPLRNEDVIKLYGTHLPDPYNQPDITFHYTNVNYVLLASVIERISGQHFEDFMQENVFAPLGMDHSYIYNLRDVDRLKTYVETDVQGHDMLRKGARRAQDDYLNGVVGDKVMYSTVDDLYKFHLALQYNTFLPDTIQREAFIPGSPTWIKGENYGFGWRMSDKHPGVRYHFGWWKGYRTYFIRDMEQDRVLIILTNTDAGVSGESLWEFFNDPAAQIPAASINPALGFD